MSDIQGLEKRLDQVEELLQAFFALQFAARGMLEVTEEESQGLLLIIGTNLEEFKKRNK